MKHDEWIAAMDERAKRIAEREREYRDAAAEVVHCARDYVEAKGQALRRPRETKLAQALEAENAAREAWYAAIDQPRPVRDEDERRGA